MSAMRPRQFRQRVRRVLLCPYCDGEAVLTPGRVVYPRRPDLWNKQFWRCRPCDAWAGCRPGTERPLGRLANAELRQARREAHAAFDPLWKRKMEREGISRTKARGAGYRWLAERLGIEHRRCRIAVMDVETCHRVVEICQAARGGRHA